MDFEQTACPCGKRRKSKKGLNMTGQEKLSRAEATQMAKSLLMQAGQVVDPERSRLEQVLRAVEQLSLPHMAIERMMTVVRLVQIARETAAELDLLLERERDKACDGGET